MMNTRRARTRATAASLVLVLMLGAIAGCATAVPAEAPQPTVSGLDGVRRIVVVTSRDSRFATIQTSSDATRVLDQVMKFLPYGPNSWFTVPAGWIARWAMTSLFDTPSTSNALQGVTPGLVVADAFARTLRLSQPLDHIIAVEGEPTGDTRRNADAIVRLTVSAWGVVPVRDGNPQLVAGFADVRAQMVRTETGALIWEHQEDVTDPERLPLDELSRDRALSRARLVDVLERAGRRLANELVYARGGRN